VATATAQFIIQGLSDFNNQRFRSPCWLAPCWPLNADVVRSCKKSQNCDVAIDAIVPLSSVVARLQLPDLLQGTTNTKLQILQTVTPSCQCKCTLYVVNE